MGEALYQSFDVRSEPALGASRLKAVRAVLASRQLDGYLLPRSDQYQNEYLPACEERLAWLSGFTGSAGYGVILMHRAAVFSDGRYTEQLKLQTDPAAFEQLSSVTTGPWSWLGEAASPGARIGYDPERHTAASLARYREAAEAQGFTLVPSTPHPVDVCWADRPAVPNSAICCQPERFAGESAADKLKWLREWLASATRDAMLITDQTCLAWLFNLRGSDVPHMPLALGYAVVPREGRAALYFSPDRLSPDVAATLSPIADVASTERFYADLRTLGEKSAHVVLDEETASIALADLLKEAGGKADLRTNPLILRKAVKNTTERKGARQAQLRDGAAVVEFLCWLDSHAKTGTLTEIDAAIAIEERRRATGKLKEISFDTISAAGPNAALPHYRVSHASNRVIEEGIFLIDSGGQYEDGTTDITRTVAVGRVNAEMKDRFTRVLKGMTAVSRAVFPVGTTGAQIDTIARTALWQAGVDFNHGTGHGVGSYLGVHEGPQRIAKTANAKLEAGMIISNEPGYYKPGAFGIRIENLVLVEERTVKGAEQPMLGFETLTFCPIDRRLVDKRLMDTAEIDWLNAYHARVVAKLTPLVGPEARRWLAAACRPL